MGRLVTASRWVHAKPKRRLSLILAAIVGIALLCAGLWLSIGRQQSVNVPEAIVQAARSPIYLPKELPGHYKIDENSFSIQENEVVMFQASDGAGGRITLTEQPRPPQEFDFDGFYREQLKEPETIHSTPFPSVFGKTPDQSMMLSIVTPETWIIATTRSPLSGDDLKLLAKRLIKY